jgi:hypothetical protein
LTSSFPEKAVVVNVGNVNVKSSVVNGKSTKDDPEDSFDPDLISGAMPDDQEVIAKQFEA